MRSRALPAHIKKRKDCTMIESLQIVQAVAARGGGGQLPPGARGRGRQNGVKKLINFVINFSHADHD